MNHFKPLGDRLIERAHNHAQVQLKRRGAFRLHNKQWWGMSDNEVLLTEYLTLRESFLRLKYRRAPKDIRIGSRTYHLGSRVIHQKPFMRHLKTDVLEQARKRINEYITYLSSQMQEHAEVSKGF